MVFYILKYNAQPSVCMAAIFPVLSIFYKTAVAPGPIGDGMKTCPGGSCFAYKSEYLGMAQLSYILFR